MAQKSLYNSGNMLIEFYWHSTYIYWPYKMYKVCYFYADTLSKSFRKVCTAVSQSWLLSYVTSFLSSIKWLCDMLYIPYIWGSALSILRPQNILRLQRMPSLAPPLLRLRDHLWWSGINLDERGCGRSENIICVFAYRKRENPPESSIRWLATRHTLCSKRSRAR
jgi:hypothetical protein